ncbi:MAG: sulfoxide reductase heme-binding subunit YedZ [Ectothiorhodospiraceae bacterium]|nr:sulfoxide reductase heme-binding subunit YedZ [Ectothiorhodospiraceae bacterium]
MGSAVVTGAAGPNPVEYLSHETGQWGLRLLLLTLAVSPLRRLTGWAWLIRFRRMLGLFAFFYVCCHFLVFAVFDHSLGLPSILEDIVKRPYILVGTLAFLLLIPLAITSTNSMMRRLGRRWKALHRFSYLIAALAVLHFFMLVKVDTREPLIYAGVLAALLLLRLRPGQWLARRTASRREVQKEA